MERARRIGILARLRHTGRQTWRGVGDRRLAEPCPAMLGAPRSGRTRRGGPWGEGPVLPPKQTGARAPAPQCGSARKSAKPRHLGPSSPSGNVRGGCRGWTPWAGRPLAIRNARRHHIAFGFAPPPPPFNFAFPPRKIRKNGRRRGGGRGGGGLRRPREEEPRRTGTTREKSTHTRGAKRRVERMRRARDFLIVELQVRAEDFLKCGFFGGGIILFLAPPPVRGKGCRTP